MLSEWCLSKLQESRKLMLFDVLTMMEGAALACSCAALEGFLGTMHANASPPPKKKKKRKHHPSSSLPPSHATHAHLRAARARVLIDKWRRKENCCCLMY